MTETLNRRIVLAARPVGAPKASDLRLEEETLRPIRSGEVLLKTLWLSLDPYMRGRMNAGRSYTAPVEIGAVMGAGTVSEVVASENPDFAVGDAVLGYAGWQTHTISDGRGLRRLDRSAAPLSAWLGVLGMPGLTAYAGLIEIGRPQPGETVAVAAATGPVGSAVGQIARIKGARAVGIAGGPDKCRALTEDFGFDAAVDHRSPTFAADLAAACPNGIDVYFENVGGPVSAAVQPLLNDFARIPVCGLVAHYNDAAPPAGPDRLPAFMRDVLSRRLSVRGFIVSDFAAVGPDFVRDMSGWLADGRVRTREDVVDGLEAAPEAFIGLLEGRNFGKLLVRMG